MRKFILVLSSLILIGCAQPAPVTEDNKLEVVTTFPPLYSMTLNVVGDQAAVHNLVPPGASIHTWEPRPSDIQKVATADIIITNGLQLEEFLSDVIEVAENPNLLVINTSTNIPTYEQEELLELSEEHKEGEDEHGHAEGVDPHIWLSISNAKQQVQNIAKAVIATDPEHQEFYQQNTQQYLAKLDQTNQQIKADLATVEPKPFVAFHDAYQYFLRSYNLTEYQVATIEPFPGQEPTPAYLQELTNIIQAQNVKVIFTEPQFTSQITEILKDELNITTLSIDPIGTQLTKNAYIDNLINIKDQLLTAFQSE